MVKVPLPQNASTKRKHKTQPLMGATRPASEHFSATSGREKDAVHTLNEGSQTALITRLSVSLCITKTLHPTKKVYNLHTNICFLPVIPLIKECVCFYCHLTLFMRNKLIFKGFKSVRWFQSILHTPAHILHITPRCLAVFLYVCGGVYATGT